MTHPATPDPHQATPVVAPRLQRVAPWVDLFFKLSAGLAAVVAIWRSVW